MGGGDEKSRYLKSLASLPDGTTKWAEQEKPLTLTPETLEYWVGFLLHAVTAHTPSTPECPFVPHVSDADGLWKSYVFTTLKCLLLSPV